MLPSSQMAIPLSLLLISCSLYSMYSPSLSTSSSLALLVLVLSTCFSLLFSNLRHLLKPSNHKAKPLPSMEVAHHEKIVPQDEASEAAEGGGGMPETPTGGLSVSSDCLMTEECTEEDSVSDDDDESLIEISLLDGQYVEQQEKPSVAWQEGGLLAELSPDLVLDNGEFIDIWSEINEEDNMIEIDIARGSIKCSGLRIEA